MGIRGLGERFDRHAKRLQALERETGMEPDPDDDSDEAKKAEEAMADDDDPYKDRGRSTRTPGQTMTRAQIHRAARDKDKQSRSGKYGNIGINPKPGTQPQQGRRCWYERWEHAQVSSHWREFQGRGIGSWNTSKSATSVSAGKEPSFPGTSWRYMAAMPKR